MSQHDDSLDSKVNDMQVDSAGDIYVEWESIETKIKTNLIKRIWKLVGVNGRNIQKKMHFDWNNILNSRV